VKYLLDTNVCISILRNTSKQLLERIRQESPSDIRICSIVKAELLHGARKSARVSENLILLNRFFDVIQSLPFDDSCAGYYGMIRADLERTGQVIGPHDMMIASIARANDLCLVTHNLSEFARIVGLRLEDWEEHQ